MLKIDSQSLIDRLTIDEVINIIESLGGEFVKEKNNEIIFTTICHHSHSHKLYYFPNSCRFHCFSNCGNMSIFDVVMKSLDISFKESFDYIINELGNKSKPKHGIGRRKSEYKSICLDEIEIPKLEPIKKQFIYNIYSKNNIKEWSGEDISYEVQQKFKIRYDKLGNRAIIPHFDIDNKCVGVRVRNFDEMELSKGKPKYIPLFYNNICYSHKLGSNLYGLNISKCNIKKYKKCVVFESEKSCMKYESMYPNNNISVAICGSSFSSVHKKLLLNLGVEEIVLCLDKEFDEYGDSESTEYEKKLIKQMNGLEGMCRCSYIIDKEGLLSKKDSPIDKGKGIFEILIKSRELIK